MQVQLNPNYEVIGFDTPKEGSLVFIVEFSLNPLKILLTINTQEKVDSYENASCTILVFQDIITYKVFKQKILSPSKKTRFVLVRAKKKKEI